MIRNGDVLIVRQKWVIGSEHFAHIHRMVNGGIEIGVIANGDG